MGVILLAFVLLGVVIGGAGMRRMGQLSRRIVGPWRPGVGVVALIALLGAGALVVRGAELEGALLAAIGLVLALVARRRAPLDKGPSPPPDRQRMSRKEARNMLGVDETAGVGEIEAAYRRLMQRVHPDLGGASGLAAQLNAAREALLKP